MFTWLNKQGVQSDRGFTVQTVSRFTVEYSEGDKKMSVYVEPGMLGGIDGKPCLSVSPNAFERWDGDPSYITLPSAKQDEILANFTAAMEFQGMSVIVESSI